MKKTIVTLSLLAIAAACGTTRNNTARKPVPTQSDADRAAAKFPGTTLADLEAGKLHYELNCGRCHSLKKPSSEPESEWRKIMPDMARKAKIDAQKEDLILRYVLTMREAK